MCKACCYDSFSFLIYLIHVLNTYAVLPLHCFTYICAATPFPFLHVLSLSATFSYSSYLHAASPSYMFHYLRSNSLKYINYSLGRVGLQFTLCLEYRQSTAFTFDILVYLEPLETRLSTIIVNRLKSNTCQP